MRLIGWSLCVLTSAWGIALGQSGGLSSSEVQVRVNQAESQALQYAGRQGGSLVQNGTVVDCDALRNRRESQKFEVPRSLVDEETVGGGSGDIIIVGPTYVIPCQ